MLPLWLGSCTGQAPAPAPPAASVPFSGPDAADPGQPLSEAPAPAPQDAPVPGTVVPPPAQTVPEADPGAAAGPGVPGKDAPEAGGDPAEEVPPPESSADPPEPGGSAPPLRMVTAYYVLLDDGGSNGVRFGCNDSLVGVARPTAGPEDALPAAVRALLEEAASADLPAPDTLDALPVMYNALSGSQLKFLSGSFDGTTVTVYLAGELSPGGTCDVPRVEAQLTQTAVAAVGAVRAEIHVNGRPLAEVLGQPASGER